VSAKHNEWHHNMPRHEGHCPTCHSAMPFGMVIEDPTAALRARCARLEGALTASHVALTAIGCRLQNDRGHWKVRKPHEDMPMIVLQVNDAMAEYHAAMAEARARGAVGS
jgi:hypothetical protein